MRILAPLDPATKRGNLEWLRKQTWVHAVGAQLMKTSGTGKKNKTPSAPTLDLALESLTIGAGALA